MCALAFVALVLRLAAMEAVAAFLFFSFAAGFVLFSLLLFLLQKRLWCSCHVCKGYVSASWAAEFDNLSDWYAHLLRASPTGTIHVHVLGSTVTANPANVEYMLKTRFDNFPKGKPFAALLGDLLGNGIFNVDGDDWRFQRKMASLALGSVSVRSYASAVVAAEIRRSLLPLLSSAAKDAAVVDLQAVFQRFAFDTICRISFGLEGGSLNLPVPMAEFAAAFDVAGRLSAARGAAPTPVIWKLKRALNVGSERELRRAIGMVKVLAEEVIRQRRRQGFADRKDLLSRFMGAAGDDDDEYLRDIVISFLLAGRDAIASGLSSFFLLLARHPRVATRMRAEIANAMGEGAGGDEAAATYEQLREMHFVHAGIYEAMRLLPPVQFDSKFCLEDDVLPDGTFVGRGTRVTYHPYAMGRMESIWGADCGEFRPERWLRGGVFTSESLFKYPVFQAGQRVCLGKEMALVEMKAVVAAVISRFDVELVDCETPLKFVPGLTATFSGGVRARVRPAARM